MRIQPEYFTRWKPDSPAAAWYVFIFFTNMLHCVQHVCEKAWNLPPCRRRVGPFIQAYAGVETDRVSPIIDTSYAVIVPEEHVASGRAEQDILFQEILALCAKIS